MTISHPQDRLAAELRELLDIVKGENAFIFDAWGLIWCWARPVDDRSQRRLYAHVKDILENLEPPLQRGAKFSRVFVHDDTPMFCASFAATYVMGIWTKTETNDLLLRRTVRTALPRIEAMTLLLPPPGGPDGSSGAQHGGA